MRLTALQGEERGAVILYADVSLKVNVGVDQVTAMIDGVVGADLGKFYTLHIKENLCIILHSFQRALHCAAKQLVVDGRACLDLLVLPEVDFVCISVGASCPFRSF